MWHQLRNAPSSGTFICHAADIPPGRVMDCRFGGDTPFAFRLFIYNDLGEYKAYRNACPHFDVPLNHTLEELVTADGRYFQCMTHYAIFDKSTGLCVEGPCEGEFLERVPLRQEGQRLCFISGIGILGTRIQSNQIIGTDDGPDHFHVLHTTR